MNTRTNFILDAGELEALTLLQMESDALFLTDDLAARKEAAKLHIHVHGSVGIVVRAFKQKLLSKEFAITALKDLNQTSTLFITRGIIEVAIQQLENC